MKHSNDWKFWLLVFPMIGTFAGWSAHAQLAARIVQTNALHHVARGSGTPISFFQATSLELLVQVPDGSIPPETTASFELWKTPDQWAMAITNAAITPGSVLFQAGVHDTSIPAGSYRYTVRLYAAGHETGTVAIAVLGYGQANVLATPYGAVAGNPPVNGITVNLLETDTTGLSNLVWATFAKTSDIPDVSGFITSTTAQLQVGSIIASNALITTVDSPFGTSLTIKPGKTTAVDGFGGSLVLSGGGDNPASGSGGNVIFNGARVLFNNTFGITGPTGTFFIAGREASGPGATSGSVLIRAGNTSGGAVKGAVNIEGVLFASAANLSSFPAFLARTDSLTNYYPVSNPSNFTTTAALGLVADDLELKADSNLVWATFAKANTLANYVPQNTGVATNLSVRGSGALGTVSLDVTNSVVGGTGIRVWVGANADDALKVIHTGTNILRVTKSEVIAGRPITTPALTTAVLAATGRIETDSYRSSMGVEIYNAARGPLDNVYQQYGAPSWHPNLVAWWRADGRTVDDSGNTNHATWTGTAAYTNGRVGGAFRVVNNGLTAPNNPTFVITNQLTMAMWVWADAHVNSFASPGGLWSPTGDQRSYGFFMSSVGGKLRWQVNGNGAAAASAILEDPSDFATGRWYHVAGTYTPSGAAIWIDGVRVATNLISGTIPASLHPSTAAFTIGGSTATTVPAWNGRIDDVRVYNIALTTSNDIRSVMLGLQPLTMSP